MLKQFFEANDEMLDLYTNAITKAHGKNHPEVFEVRKLYETIQHKIQGNNMDLSNEFSELRGVTNDFAIPDDVCETFTKTYQLLKQFVELSQELVSSIRKRLSMVQHLCVTLVPLFNYLSEDEQIEINQLARHQQFKKMRLFSNQEMKN